MSSAENVVAGTVCTVVVAGSVCTVVAAVVGIAKSERLFHFLHNMAG